MKKPGLGAKGGKCQSWIDISKWPTANELRFDIFFI